MTSRSRHVVSESFTSTQVALSDGMNALRFALRTLSRDWKSGELNVLLLAVIVAVAALTAVGFFTNRVSQAVTVQAAQVLAADLRLQSSRPLDGSYATAARAQGLRTASALSLVSVIFHDEKSQLTSVRAVDAAYPLRGAVRVAEQPFARGYATRDVPGRGEIWPDSRLLATLDASVGSILNVGAASLRVARVLDYRPDQGSTFAELAPNALMNLADIPATQLVQPGSRVTYLALFAGTRDQVATFKAYLEGARKAGERLLDIAEASPQVRSSTDRAGRFLNLAGLVSVLLAAVAVAMASRRYAHRHLDSVALMKCIGASQRFILIVSVLELIALAVICALIGTLVGYLGQEVLAWLLKDLIVGELPEPA